MRQEVVLQSLKDITEINIDDGVTFKINGITNIRLDDQYGGFQIKIVGKFDNIKHEFNVDIATGDPIIPSEWDYSYECLLTGELLSIKAYSLESVVAEKLETVFARQIANSRSKDFYDLYVLRKLKKDEFDKCLLQRAFLESCKYRQLIIGKNEAISLLNEIGNNKQINDRWEAFTKRMKYANNLAFNDVITSILDWIMIFLIESSISGQRQIKKENYSPFKFCHFLQRIYRQ